MEIDKYCDDGLLFTVLYQMESGHDGISHFMFPIDYTEAQVKETLTNDPYNIKVSGVFEESYVLKMKPKYVN